MIEMLIVDIGYLPDFGAIHPINLSIILLKQPTSRENQRKW
jgi:hypothetical protein